MNTTCKFASAGLMAVTLTAFGLVSGTAAQAAGLKPVGETDYYSMPQGGTLTIPAPGILANDSDPEGDAIYVGNDFSYTAADYVKVNADGSFTFTPSPSYFGQAGFHYYPSDGQLGNETAVVITVTPAVPTPPVVLVANADSYATAKNTALVVPASAGILANDTGPAFVAKVNDFAGEVVVDQYGGFVYTPAPGFVGTKVFGYATSNGTSLSNDALVSIVVTDPAAPPVLPPVVAPVASPDAYSTVQDTTLTVPAATGLLANDSFPAGALVEIDDVTGEIVAQPDGSFVYTPTAGFVGLKEFAYRMTDGTTPSDWAYVGITVTAAPVAPVDPTDPADPTDPVDPADPTDPVDTGLPAPLGAVDSTVPAPSSAGELPTLAYTGVAPTTGIAASAAALLGLGGAGLWLSRRRRAHR